MDDDQNNEGNGIVAWILGIAVTIAIAVAIIPAIIAAMNANPAPVASAAPTAPAATTAPAAVSAGPDSLAAVEFYFDTGKNELPADANTQLAAMIEAVKGGKAAKLAISGFHDKTGNAEQNAELAKNRALAVKQALIAAGLTEQQIEMRKPQETTGGADDREARRVEVSAAN
jgi:cytochrome c oxidase subunit II